MPSLHLTSKRVPHPAITMLGRSQNSSARRDDLPVASNSPVWKIHAFARGVFHWQVGEVQMRITSGYWLIVPPGVVHGGVDQTRERGLFYWLHARPDRVWPGLHRSEQESLWKVLRPGLYATRYDMIHHWERLIMIVQKAKAFRTGRFECEMGAMMHQVLADIQQENVMHRDTRGIERVRQFIDDHLDQELRIEHLAQMAGLRRTRFCDLFKAVTGMGPRDYIQSQRVEQAKVLLRDSHRSVLMVAMDVGFSSSQAFATAFKRTTGMSPRAWRQTPHE